MDLEIVILQKSHIKDTFDCGYPSLDDYIRKQASQDVKRDLSACYVLSDEQNKVIGYYTLSSNSIPREELPQNLVKKLPRTYGDLPTILLGRLAVDVSAKGNRYGEYLLLDALERSAMASDIIGTLAVIVEPIDEKAMSFYEKYGFIKIPDSGKMFITINTIKQD